MKTKVTRISSDVPLLKVQVEMELTPEMVQDLNGALRSDPTATQAIADEMGRAIAKFYHEKQATDLKIRLRASNEIIRSGKATKAQIAAHNELIRDALSFRTYFKKSKTEEMMEDLSKVTGIDAEAELERVLTEEMAKSTPLPKASLMYMDFKYDDSSVKKEEEMKSDDYDEILKEALDELEEFKPEEPSKTDPF